MTLRLANVVVDCDDVLTVARFWSTALRRPLDPDPNPYFTTIGRTEPPDEVRWFFAKVPEPRTAKNRVHVDLVADDAPAEVERLLSLGATKLAEKAEHGQSWTVLQDPEGNEFCLAQSP
jgi:predicted enzyme related to lactoylglutathione lyase